MYFATHAAFDSLLACGRVESSQRVEFGVNFKIFRQVVPHYYAGEPTIVSCMDVVVAGFPVQIDGPELFRKLQGKNHTGAAGSDAAGGGVVRIVERNLGKNGDGESGFFVVIKSPFDAELILAEAVFGRAGRIDYAQPRIFKGELDAIAQTVIDVYVRLMGDGIVGVEEGHVAQVDFPIVIAGGAGIVRVIGRPSLRKHRGAGKHEYRERKKSPWPESSEYRSFIHGAPFQSRFTSQNSAIGTACGAEFSRTGHNFLARK